MIKTTSETPQLRVGDMAVYQFQYKKHGRPVSPVQVKVLKLTRKGYAVIELKGAKRTVKQHTLSQS